MTKRKSKGLEHVSKPLGEALDKIKARQVTTLHQAIEAGLASPLDSKATAIEVHVLDFLAMEFSASMTRADAVAAGILKELYLRIARK